MDQKRKGKRKQEEGADRGKKKEKKMKKIEEEERRKKTTDHVSEPRSNAIKSSETQPRTQWFARPM